MARAGEVEVFTPRGSQWVTAGQMMVARGANADPEFQIVNAIPPDDWDRWNDSSRPEPGAVVRALNMLGRASMARRIWINAGTWSDVPPYGNVWRPTM